MCLAVAFSRFVPMTRVFLLLAVFVMLGACAPRGPIVVAPDIDVSQGVRIFAATSRAPDETGWPGTERAQGLSYLSIDVSVPPQREAGEITLAGRPPDPQTEFLAQRAIRYGSEPTFKSDLRQAIAAQPRGEREVVVYVHGFNTTFAEAVMRMAQLATDLDIDAIPVVYSWPSIGLPLGYEYDQDSALFSRDGLEQLIGSLQGLGAERVLLVGHSMGTLLATETMRQMAIAEPGAPRRQLGGVVLIAPDIDVDLFRRQAERIGDLPDPFIIVTSQRDRALLLSARLSGQRARLGNIDDVSPLAKLEVTVVNVTEFGTGIGHLTAVESPVLLSMMGQMGGLEDAFRGPATEGLGLGSVTVLTLQNATEIILTPATELLR